MCLHATDPAAVYLSAWARVAEPWVEAVERALYDDRSLRPDAGDAEDDVRRTHRRLSLLRAAASVVVEPPGATRDEQSSRCSA